jgi:hypothetical protein
VTVGVDGRQNKNNGGNICHFNENIYICSEYEKIVVKS